MGEDIFKMYHWQKELLQTTFFFKATHFLMRKRIEQSLYKRGKTNKHIKISIINYQKRANKKYSDKNLLFAT